MVECSASSSNNDADLLQQQEQQQIQEQQQQQQQDHQQQQELQQDQQPNNPDNNNIKQQQTNSLAQQLFSTKGWGDTPVRQDTPWDLPPSPSTNDSATTSATSTQSSTVGGGLAQTLPPGISQSGDSSRGGNVDFHNKAMMNNSSMEMGANGLANSIGHMNLGGSVGGVMHPSARFEQPWRAPMASKPQQPQQHQQSLGSTSPFANPNLMNSTQIGMPKTMLNSSSAGSGNGVVQQSSFAVGMPSGVSQSSGDSFTRAPGPTSSIMDNKSKPFGVANRSSTWSAFGTSAYSDSESEWPKSSGISAGASNQAPTTFDLIPDFEAGKSWPSSMLMKTLDDDQNLNSVPTTIGSGFPGSYTASTKSPTDNHNDASGIGTWSPVVKSNRSGSKWDGVGADIGGGDGGRFDDGTAIWGSPAQKEVLGIDWVEKSSDANGNDDKSRNIAGNNQAYRSQQSSTSASLLMSSNFSPPTHNRNPQTMKQPPLSHNFEQSNALPSQANQPNRGLGLPSNNNVPSAQHLKHMVQQIQLAVHAGHLNPQILNQPLAPVTLQLLYQLLQQIKVLHQYQMQASSKQQQFGKPGNHPATVNVQITKTKQNIINLQNQIAAQQALYIKQTQAQNISSRQPAMPGLNTGAVGGSLAQTLPPGISQSGDSSRGGNDFHNKAMMNNFNMDMGANGLANSIGHMNLGNSSGVMQPTSRFDQPWRATMAKQQHQPTMGSTSPFANPNLMNSSQGVMPKTMLNTGPGGSGNGVVQQSSFAVGIQSAVNQGSGDSFTRAPGPTSSIMDNKSKPFGVANRSSTWSAFGTSAYSDSESEWPKSSGISASGSSQHNAVDLVPEFEPGKPWRGSMLMKSVEDDPTMTPGSMARSLAPQRKTIWSDEIL